MESDTTLDANVDDATVDKSGMKEITAMAAMLKQEVVELESALKAKKDEFNRVSEQILKTMDLLELDSVRAHGFLFYKETKSSVTTPKTLEEKAELFKFLEERGIFHEMVSIHSQTLNSLYKSLADEAAEAGNYDFRLPGVAEPTSYTTLKLRRG